MKKFKFFAVALAALTMFSCSKENITDNPGNNTPGDKAVINLKIVGSGADKSTKVVGDPGATTDVVIKSGTVYLFRDGGALDCVPITFTGTTIDKITTATTAAKTLYVVANTPKLTITTEKDLIAATGDLFDGEVCTQTKDQLWMSGKKELTFTGKEATPIVPLKFVSARIDLVVKDNRKNNVAGTGKISIKDNNVSLLFAGAKCHFFDVTKMGQTNFYSGFATKTTTNTVRKAALTGVAGTFNANAAGAISHHFYTFANDAKVMPTILTIASTKTNADATTTEIYYPIQLVDAELAGAAFVPGTKYTITIVLNGDVGTGGGGGTTDPEKPIVSADITVTITPAAWESKLAEKVFN